jgi:anti-anti-sigma regulatory factor
MLDLQIVRAPHQAVWRLTGRLDAASARLLRLIKVGDGPVSVDVTEVDGVDEPGLGGLIAAILRVRRLGGSVRIVGLGPELIARLRALGIDRLADLRGDR